MTRTGLLNLLLGRLPSYTRKSRHLELLRRYASFQKLLNIAKAELSRARGDIVVHAFPYVYTIDTGNVCNLRCPLCPTGAQTLERPQALMTLPLFRSVIDQIRPYAVEAILHNWGEPFLNPHILSMVRYAKENRIGTTISSNLNLVNRGSSFLEDVVDSGLDHLTVSLDGTTQDVYQQYRRGGDLESVLGNLRHLIEYRNRNGARTPRVEWQFLVLKTNQHQIEAARKLALEIGVDRFRLIGAGLPFDDLLDDGLAAQWISDLPEYRGYAPEKFRKTGHLYDEGCFYLYRGMTVNPEGGVAPCCVLYHDALDFGDLSRSSLGDVWNNEHYRSSRALFSGKPYETKLSTGCHRCPLFKYETGGSSVPVRVGT